VLCGDPRRYRKVRILRTVWAFAFCETQCALVKGRSHSAVQLRVRTGPARRLTAIGMIASPMSFKRFLRAARSLRRVKPASAAPLEEFLSSDGSVSSGMQDQCGVSVAPDDTRSCGTGQPVRYDLCTQNRNSSAIHPDGHSLDFGGSICTDHGGAVGPP